MKDIYAHQNENGTFDVSFKGAEFASTFNLTRDELERLKEQIVKADDESVIIE